MPNDWERIVSERVAAWHQLDPEEREEIASISDWLLRRKYWEAAQGFALRDDITVTIAAQAALLVLALGTDYYREVGSIIVYPSTMLSRGERAGPVPGTVTDDAASLLGEAHDRRGPILIAWDAAEHAARHPDHGDNVVYHEFAHKIDMLDRLVDGNPPLDGQAARERWERVCAEVYRALAHGLHRPPLNPYGAVDRSEFFAVATEAFFAVPLELRDQRTGAVRGAARLLQAGSRSSGRARRLSPSATRRGTQVLPRRHAGGAPDRASSSERTSRP